MFHDFPPAPGLGATLAGGFFAGVETPKLMRKKRKPLRRESRTLIWNTRFHNSADGE